MKNVYFFKPIGMSGPIKIGCSATPKARLLCFDIWSPFPLEMLAMAPGDHSDERALHWRFRETRSHGEWFFASDELAEVIDHVRRHGALPETAPVPRGESACSRDRNPRRVDRQAKAGLTLRITAAERHAFGYGHSEHRAQWVKDAIESWQGPHTPGPDEELVQRLNLYIADLRRRPKCSRTFQDWVAWRERKAA